MQNRTTMDRTGGLPRLLVPLELPPGINMPVDPYRLAWIYGLSDPRDGGLRVIGRAAGWRIPGALDGMEPGEVPARPSPRQAWAADLARAYRTAVTHLLACVPQDQAEDYKRLYIEAAQALGAPLVVRAYGADLDVNSTTRIKMEAWWALREAYPALAAGVDGWPPVYSAEVRARLARPGLSRRQWIARHGGGREDAVSDEYDALRWEAFAHQQDEER